MASSQSIGMANTPTVCQFCEDSPDIKWKCVNCELFLCEMCRSKIHSKSKASMEHEIINIKDFGIEDLATSMRKVELENMMCTIHAKQKCFVFCKDCSQSACSKCLMETHKLHEYKALDEVYIGIFSEMIGVIKKIDSDLKFFLNEKEKLQKNLSDGDKNFQETREIILQTKKKIIKAISKQAIELLNELEGKWKPSENMIKTELSIIIENEDELKTRKNNLIQALHSFHVDDIFSTRKTLDRSLPTYQVKQINPIRTKFSPRKIEVKKGSQLMLGDIYTIPNLELMDTYQSNIRSVTKILFCNTNIEYIIGSSLSQKLQKVEFKNHETKLQREHKILVCDIAKNCNDKMIVSSGRSDLIQIDYGQLKTLKSFSPLKTLCVHVTKNQIIVGLAESYPVALPLSKESIRRLIIMNQDGDIQHTIEYMYHHYAYDMNYNNHEMLTYPHRVKTFNDDIIVVDIMNNGLQGRVLMLDYRGQINWSYFGCKSTEFYPRDLAITSQYLILVSDCNNHAIHVLNPAGKVIAWKDVNILGIEYPFSLAIDNNEALWIGCSTWKTDTIKKDNIHCVKLT